MHVPRGWLPRAPNVVALLEAAYRVDRDEIAWSRHITEAFAPSVPGATFVGGLVFDASAEAGLTARAMSSDRAVADAWTRWADAGEMAPYLTRVFPVGSWVGSATDNLGEDFSAVATSMRDAVPVEMADAWSVTGANLQRQGYMLSAATPKRVETPPPGLQQQWMLIAAHISAAFCLRENMARGLSPEESVLSPDGRLLHAEGVAKTPSAREALRRAVRGIDAARSKHSQQPTESLDAWQAIVSGRWTLVETHERDGRRYLVARVNELTAPANKALSSRERQIVGLVAQGASNKEIAYRLGIGEPSVAGYLRRARTKLGMRGRGDLSRPADQPACPEAEPADTTLRGLTLPSSHLVRRRLRGGRGPLASVSGAGWLPGRPDLPTGLAPRAARPETPTSCPADPSARRMARRCTARRCAARSSPWAPRP